MSALAFSQSELPQQIRFTAMGLLARREHSCGELRQKLAKKFPEESDLIDLTITRLSEQDLQSEKRFVEAFVNSRISRSQGPIRIIQDLRNRQVENSLISEWVVKNDRQWFDLAIETRARRFGLAQLTMNNLEEKKLKAKQQRFLLYRGFTPDQVHQALNYQQGE